MKLFPDMITGTWNELNEFIDETRTEYPTIGLWKRCERKIESITIEALYNEGWRAREVSLTTLMPMEDILGWCSYKTKELLIQEKQGPYSRDKILCHELVHAIFPYEYLYENKKEWGDDERRIMDFRSHHVVEWLSRKIRANQDLLKIILTTFNLQPYRYDKTTHEAFPEAPCCLPDDKQILFDFAPENNREKILLD